MTSYHKIEVDERERKMKFKVISILFVLFVISMVACYVFLIILFYFVLGIMGLFILSRLMISYNRINELADKLTYYEIGLIFVKKALKALLSWESKEYQLEPGKGPQLETTLDSLNQLRLEYVRKISHELSEKGIERRI